MNRAAALASDTDRLMKTCVLQALASGGSARMADPGRSRKGRLSRMERGAQVKEETPTKGPNTGRLKAGVELGKVAGRSSRPLAGTGCPADHRSCNTTDGNSQMPRMPKKPEPDIVVVSRYSREDYPAVYALAKDGGHMEESYDDWLELTETACATIIAQGKRLERVDIRSHEFAAWLKAKGFESTPETRAHYVHEVASAKFASKH